MLLRPSVLSALRGSSSRWSARASSSLLAAAHAPAAAAASSAAPLRCLHPSPAPHHNHKDWPQRSHQHFRELKAAEDARLAAEAAQPQLPYFVVRHPHPLAAAEPANEQAQLTADGEDTSSLFTPASHFAIMRHRNSQFKVVEGDLLMVDRLSGRGYEVGDAFTVEEVLMLAGRDATLIGRPLVHGAQVVCRVEEHTHTAKVLAFKKKRRKGFKKKIGSRDLVSLIRIEKVLLPEGVEPLTQGAKVEYASEANVKKTKQPSLAAAAAATAPPSSASIGGARLFSTLSRRSFSTVATPTSTPSESDAQACQPTTEATIKSLLSQELQASTLHVQDTSGGCGAFFRVLVVSPQFNGLSMVKQHRLVNSILKPHIANLHGLTLQTFTEEQWQEQLNKHKAA